MWGLIAVCAIGLIVLLAVIFPAPFTFLEEDWRVDEELDKDYRDYLIDCKKERKMSRFTVRGGRIWRDDETSGK